MTFNFNAGPATLPKPVLEQAQKEFLDYHGLGISIIEASHRSKEFDEVIKSAEAGLRKLLQIPDSYAVLFLQGGASLQFAMVPMNIQGEGTADYIDTGAWSSKAFKEADNLGRAKIIASSKASNYDHIPTFSPELCSDDASYLHITSNNTIFGTQYKTFPEPPAGVPLVADMSSDILSRPLDVSKFGIIYAGAQKNIGPSGVTVVIIRKDLAERSPASLPTMLNYNTHIDKESLFNT
ncbi:MAG: 3-phosphoserine/phosphohydroxythreonine transaminase, partial [Lentisphaerae bacterium]